MHNFSEIEMVIQFWVFSPLRDLPLFYHNDTGILCNTSKLYFITIFHNICDLFCNAKRATST